VYGTATISATQGCISYTPPASLMGLPPADVMTVQVKDGFGNMDTVVVNIPFAIFVIDACGLCGGDGTSCAGCDGVPNSGLVFDRCGVCGGDGTTCPSASKCDWMCILIQFFMWTAAFFVIFVLLTITRRCTWYRRRPRPPNVVPFASAYTDNLGRTFNPSPGPLEYRPAPPSDTATRLWSGNVTSNVVTARDRAETLF